MRWDDDSGRSGRRKCYSVWLIIHLLWMGFWCDENKKHNGFYGFLLLFILLFLRLLFTHLSCCPCCEKREGIKRKKSAIQWKRQWEKFESSGFLDTFDSTILHASSFYGFDKWSVVYSFLISLSFHSESHGLGFIEVTRGIEEGRKKVMTAMEFCRNGFLRLRYPRSLMPMYCLLLLMFDA